MGIWELLKSNYELIVALSSMVIALSALLISFWQGFLSRKYSRLSLLPSIAIHVFAIAHKKSFKITIKNTGSGPAIIKSLKIFVNGKEYKNTISDWQQILRSGEFPAINNEYESTSLEDNYQLMPGTEDDIISVIMHDEIIDQVKLMSFVRKILIKIEYHSVYNQKLNTESKFN